MIKVIMIDESDNDIQTVMFDRDSLKYDGMKRMEFSQAVNHLIREVMFKLRQEVRREN